MPKIMLANDSHGTDHCGCCGGRIPRDSDAHDDALVRDDAMCTGFVAACGGCGAWDWSAIDEEDEIDDREQM